MVVLVGLIIEMVDAGICSSTTLMVIITGGIIVVTGLMHPQEISNLLGGLLYFLLVPSMYLILVIYSLCNINAIAWGTRETSTAAKLADEDRLLREAAEANGGAAVAAAERVFDGYRMSCGSCCHCLCCPRPGYSPQDMALHSIQRQLDRIVFVQGAASSGVPPAVGVTATTAVPAAEYGLRRPRDVPGLSAAVVVPVAIGWFSTSNYILQ